MKTVLYLVRHGAYDSSTPVVPYRLRGFHLSEQGKKQVDILTRALEHENIAAVYTSPIERTRETAEILAKPHELTPIVDDRLNEVRSPAQGKTKEYIDSLGGWFIYETPWYKEQKGESLQEVLARILEFIKDKQKAHAGQSIIVVTHGDPAMLHAAHCQGFPLTPESLARFPYVPLAGGYRIEFDDAGTVHVASIVIPS